MSKKLPRSTPYYYAGGRKIKLTPAKDLLAIDGAAKTAADAPRPAGRALTGGLRLVATDQVPAAEDRRDSASRYPVYRSQGAIVVALPEIRVEESDVAHRARLDAWLAERGDSVTVVSRDADRIVLRPVSGRGEDALTLANDLAEDVGPELAQARFIRIAPRPGA